MVRIPFISAGVAVLLMTGAVMAQSRGLTVELDHSARIQLAGSASSVIVGNPRIADVTVVNDRTLFVSGRGHGVTDVIVNGVPAWQRGRHTGARSGGVITRAA